MVPVVSFSTATTSMLFTSPRRWHASRSKLTTFSPTTPEACKGKRKLKLKNQIDHVKALRPFCQDRVGELILLAREGERETERQICVLHQVVLRHVGRQTWCNVVEQLKKQMILINFSLTTVETHRSASAFLNVIGHAVNFAVHRWTAVALQGDVQDTKIGAAEVKRKKFALFSAHSNRSDVRRMHFDGSSRSWNLRDNPRHLNFFAFSTCHSVEALLEVQFEFLHDVAHLTVAQRQTLAMFLDLNLREISK